ncbi:MAG: hypothetical protein ACJART_000413 [Maribacter sp.]|jgi:hypothetical protein
MGCLTVLCCMGLNAQQTAFASLEKHKMDATVKRMENFKDMKSMGYTEKEIYQDLGNAHFLSENYEHALFWYDRLIDSSDDGVLEPSYQKRYDHAVSKLGKTSSTEEETDENWTELVRADYHMTQASPKKSSVSFRDRFKPLNLAPEREKLAAKEHMSYKDAVIDKNKLDYETPVSLTKDGNTAYYSKTVYVKPSTGIFSKKEPVHKIYRADKVQGEWKSIRELALCPNEFSAVHPAVSPDGKRLFFASNMPGTFGDFDIYVASLGSNGSIGVAKNLGEKVNTVRNDMYPKVMEGNTLVFASEGHQGYGGLDMYSVQVASSSVGLAINMGSSINSSQDDFALQLAPQKGMAYVVSNRGSKTKSAHKIEYTFVREKRNSNETDFRLLEAMNTAEQAKYSTSIFEDE